MAYDLNVEDIFDWIDYMKEGKSKEEELIWSLQGMNLCYSVEDLGEFY